MVWRIVVQFDSRTTKLVHILEASRALLRLGSTQHSNPRPCIYKEAGRPDLTSLLPADYVQLELPFTSSGDGTEFVWKRDIQLGWKALLLKPKQLPSDRAASS